MTATGAAATALALVADGKGVLAIDESTHTCDERWGCPRRSASAAPTAA